MITYGFILPNGTELPMKRMDKHEDYAIEYIRNNNLMADYKSSEYNLNPIDFMVLALGAIKVGNWHDSKTILAKFPYFSKEVEHLVRYYELMGYTVERIGKNGNRYY